MKEFLSFLSPQLHAFIRYRQASQRWNDSSYEENLMLFDHYCHEDCPEFPTEMVSTTIPALCPCSGT